MLAPKLSFGATVPTGRRTELRERGLYYEVPIRREPPSCAVVLRRRFLAIRVSLSASAPSSSVHSTHPRRRHHLESFGARPSSGVLVRFSCACSRRRAKSRHALRSAAPSPILIPPITDRLCQPLRRHVQRASWHCRRTGSAKQPPCRAARAGPRRV
jgi:hypothetical protein